MPTWLVHGFRWPRAAIRIHIILHNLEDCAPEWLMAPATAVEMKANFNKLYADEMKHLPTLRFIEQYDPEDITTKDQPYAYVCDQIHEVKLGVDIDEVRGQGVSTEAWSAIVELRDKVAAGAKVGWFVVVNGDVERWAPPLEDDETEGFSENGFESQISPTSQRSSVARSEEKEDGEQAKPKGIKKWFKRAKSSKDLRNDLAYRSMPQSPPLPSRPVNVARNANGKAPITAGSA